MDLTDQVLNVSENLSSAQELILLNQNGATTFLYLFTENVTGVEPGCNPAGDISFELEKESVIDDGTNFTMNPAFNIFNFTITAVNNRVCPQNITVTLDFTEI